MKLADLPLNTIKGPETAISPDPTGVEKTLSIVIGFLTIIGGLLFIIMFIIGTYTWITAEGKPDKMEKARNQITQAITGLVILVGAFAITAVISTLLGIDIFNIVDAINNLSK